jgi:hypothetical protein
MQRGAASGMIGSGTYERSRLGSNDEEYRMDMRWRVLSTGATLAATLLTTKVITAGWKAATGKEPPVDEDDPEVEWWEVMAFTVVSGALLGLARHFAVRGATKVYGGPVEKRIDKV